MQTHKWNAIRCLTLVIASALALVAVLLWWTSGHAPAVQASTRPEPVGRLTEPIVAARYSDVSAAWALTTPITKIVPDTGETIWDISEYSVTITFFPTSFSNQYGAVFTFTPAVSAAFPAPLSSTSYFFELEGKYLDILGRHQNEVSLSVTGIKIELEYDPNGISLQESSLRMFHLAGTIWEDETAAVNPVTNRIWWTKNHLGQFGMGGYRSQVFVPLVLRSAVAGSSAAGPSSDLSLSQ